MDGGLLQKQSKQVINMTMGTRMGSQTKTQGGGGGRGRWWWRGGECVCVVCVCEVQRHQSAEKIKRSWEKQKTLMCCEILSSVLAEVGQITFVQGLTRQSVEVLKCCTAINYWSFDKVYLINFSPQCIYGRIMQSWCLDMSDEWRKSYGSSSNTL